MKFVENFSHKNTVVDEVFRRGRVNWNRGHDPRTTGREELLVAKTIIFLVDVDQPSRGRRGGLRIKLRHAGTIPPTYVLNNAAWILITLSLYILAGNTNFPRQFLRPRLRVARADRAAAELGNCGSRRGALTLATLITRNYVPGRGTVFSTPTTRPDDPAWTSSLFHPPISRHFYTVLAPGCQPARSGRTAPLGFPILRASQLPVELCPNSMSYDDNIVVQLTDFGNIFIQNKWKIVLSLSMTKFIVTSCRVML